MGPTQEAFHASRFLDPGGGGGGVRSDGLQQLQPVWEVEPVREEQLQLVLEAEVQLVREDELQRLLDAEAGVQPLREVVRAV